MATYSTKIYLLENGQSESLYPYITTEVVVAGDQFENKKLDHYQKE